MKFKFTTQQVEFLKNNIPGFETNETRAFIDALKASVEIETEYVMGDKNAEIPASIVTMISAHPEY